MGNGSVVATSIPRPSKNGVDLLEGHHEIDAFVAACLLAFGYARADEDHLRVGVFLLGDPRGVIHRRSGARNEGLHLGDMLVGQFDPRRTAGGGHERLSLLNFLFEFRTFIADGFHGALRYFDHVLETDGLNRAIYFFRGALYCPRMAGATTATIFSPSRRRCSTSNTCEISKIAPNGQLLMHLPQ